MSTFEYQIKETFMGGLQNKEYFKYENPYLKYENSTQMC